MPYLVRVFATATAILWSPLSFATDEDRSGFYLSGGIGGHSTSLSSETNYVGGAAEQVAGFTSSIKIGGFLNPQFALYYLGESVWWQDQELTASGITGIGGSYYFGQHKSPYVEFGFGIGSTLWMDAQTVQLGTALQAGAGYELTPNVQLGASLLSVKTTDYMDVDETDSTFSISVKAEFRL